VVDDEDRIEDLLRELAPQVLSTLVRRHGQFDACEDAVQEALLAAARQWRAERVPDRPRSWLLTVARRSLVDEWRSESARRRREQTMVALEPLADPQGAARPPADQDDTLTLLFLCCHPALSAPSQLALTLRAVGGLTTTEIAAAFLVPEATMAQRISRAKQRIRSAGARFELPAEPERAEHRRVVPPIPACAPPRSGAGQVLMRSRGNKICTSIRLASSGGRGRLIGPDGEAVQRFSGRLR
jgi:RNA polymerase sigma factor (sigma-70 family)